MIWKCDDTTVNTYTEASLLEKISKLTDAEAKELLIHIYTYEGKVMEIKGDGKFWNHSHVNQNTGNHPDGLGDGESEYAMRDIEVGEELLSDYSSYHPVGWFEEMCKKYGASSCIEIGTEFNNV